jgi:hypothetical protein
LLPRQVDVIGWIRLLVDVPEMGFQGLARVHFAGCNIQAGEEPLNDAGGRITLAKRGFSRLEGSQIRRPMIPTRFQR